MKQAKVLSVVSGWNQRVEVFGDICWEKILASSQTMSRRGQECWRTKS
jgi:hypothetical protein